MTREAINKTPETWLDFYPHKKFAEFLATLLDVIASGSKSVWMTGNHGTGKSNASLVVQKLFMDDETRVRNWFELCNVALVDRESVENGLFAHRNDGTLVVYDYNASGVGPTEEFLVRLEKGIIAALNERGLPIPASSNLDSVVQRLKREGAHFFAIRDAIQYQLAYLHSDIKTVEQLVDALNKEHNTTDAPTHLFDEVQRVFHTDNIYLDVDVTTFRQWIAAILAANDLKRIVYIFDEFSEFVDANKGQLKTFEDVTENPDVNHFFLVPVTHLDIGAFWSENSAGARKARDRFHFRNLQMPNDTAFKLAKHAMKDNPDPQVASEWKTEKDNLWTSVSTVADKFRQDDVSRQSFYDILPIHPMAAFLLKFLSESARSNQRSIFEYLKGSADGKEFQDFIRSGGPEIENKQFLTVNYLWKYFIEREDLGLIKEITTIRAEYERIRNREFFNQTDDAVELRILKAVLLFCLLEQLSPDGHERLKPTVENIELSFKGDGTIADVAGILKQLAERHCFSVVNNSIELFATTVDNAALQTKIAEQETKFHDLLHEKIEKMLEEHTKNARASHSAGRFEIRVSDASHTTLTNITSSVRDRYGKGQNKDSASVCLWFVVAQNKEEQLLIPDKITGILTQLRDHRILMFTFPQLSFCHDNTALWSDYVRQYSQYLLENDGVAKNQIKTAYERLEREWFDKIKQHSATIKVYSAQNGQVVTNDTSWGKFKELLSDYVRRTLPNCVDYLTQQLTIFGNSVKGWATVGILFNAVSGPQGQLVKSFKGQGISDTVDWFSQNPKHPLAETHALFEKKISNSIGKGGTLSVRKVYIELQRAPFGMRCNALSAFVLGFVLRDILNKNYQWTNGQLTKPLDADTLAEIIEAVVKNDGNENMRGEKTICRLSKEEKAFVEKAPAMFGVPAIQDATVESVLGQIQSRIESVSVHVPLWVLTEYVCYKGDSKAQAIEEILNNVCMAFATSSKGKTEDRTNAVKEAGSAILADLDIVDVIAGYIKTENFAQAFEIYVDKESSELAELAKSIGDISHEYCRTILRKAAETAGWLWKQADISKEIDTQFCEYEIISLVKSMCGFAGFVSYKNVFDALTTAVTKTNHLPKSILESEYPALSNFLSALQTGGSVEDIKSALSQSADVIEELFFDLAKSKSVKILKTRLNDARLSDSELLDILNGTSGGFGLDEGTFLDGIRAKIEEYTKQSVTQNLKIEWTRLSGAKTPSEWAIENGIPARLLFDGLNQTDDLLKAIEQPDTYAAMKLAELLDVLKETTVLSIADCQKVFLAETVPLQYAKFNISLASLLEFLRGKHGAQPNDWPRHPDISEFIRGQYKGTLAPQIKESIRSRGAEELKQKLLQLADENPELGLLFWEG
jgi:hypothetical protein